MKHRLRRYDVFRFAQNDVARFTRNDAMFALMCPQAHIIRRSRHHWHSQHHFPKANIIQKTHLCLGRQKCVFCCLRTTKRCVKWGKNGKKYTRTLLDKLEFVNLCNLFYFSMYSSIKIVSKHLRIFLHSAMNPPPDSFYKGC